MTQHLPDTPDNQAGEGLAEAFNTWPCGCRSNVDYRHREECAGFTTDGRIKDRAHLGAQLAGERPDDFGRTSQGIAGQTQMVEITYTAILPVTVFQGWFIGQAPRNLSELYREVVRRRMRGHEVLSQVSCRMNQAGKLPAKAVHSMTPAEFQAWQEQRDARRDEHD